MKIGRITNENKLVEEKVNYFLDKISYAIDYVGCSQSLELESPTSLIEKIIYRLKDDTGRMMYLDNYFRQSFFTEDTFWDIYPTYLEIKEIVSKYNAATDKKEKNKLIDSATFQRNLDSLHKDLKHKMPDDITKAVLNAVVCKHRLDEVIQNEKNTHSAQLSAIALLLVSEYYYRGYTSSEIEGIVSNVFSNNETRFPFPTEVRTLTQKKKYLNEKNLQQQLAGFANIFKQPPKKGIVVVKVYGGQFPETFSFQYDKVKFWGINHPKIEKIKSEMNKDHINMFFRDGAYILASMNVEWYSDQSLLKKIKTKIGREVTFLSATFDRDFNVDTTRNFIRLDSKMKFKSIALSTHKFDNPFTENDLKYLTDNSFYTLRKLKGEAVDWFLKYESLYVNARKTGSIADYWLYLETLLSYGDTKRVRSIISSVILLNESLIHDQRILITLANSLNHFSNNTASLNIPQEKNSKIQSTLCKGKIPRELKKIKYPFIEELIEEFEKKISQSEFEKAEEYYNRILIEAYEYRNFIVHKGIENEASLIKLSISLPIIIRRFRWLVFDSIKKGHYNLPFRILIEKLEENVKQLKLQFKY